MTSFKRIEYTALNSRQRENYNFAKVAARLADYGFNCLRLTDDWNGADFIAVHIGGQNNNNISVQLKGSMAIYRKYVGKGLHVAFIDGDDCYVYPHDELVAAFVERRGNADWPDGPWPTVPRWATEFLQPYKI